MLRKFFKKMKEGTETLNYGRDIIQQWGADYLLASKQANARPAKQIERRLLDIGCGHGTDLLNIRDAYERRRQADDESVRIVLEGIENFSDYVKECRTLGIRISSLDIERGRIPAEDGRYDIVIANQVLEHVKEIFWIFAEATRILKPGGRFIIGVPNLASLHNRLLLAFGRHPTAQQSLSAHVRTFTRPDLTNFAETGGYFRFRASRGSNFYPFGPSLSIPLSRMLPGCAWGLFVMLERTNKKGNFLDVLSGDDNFLETPYYGSPQNPARKTKKSARRTSAKTAKRT